MSVAAVAILVWAAFVLLGRIRRTAHADDAAVDTRTTLGSANQS
jgi:hypothetical protein